MTQTALLVLLPVVAALTLCQRRRLMAVIGMGVFSLLLSAVYLLAAAPDVAIAEAAIGAALVTVIYVLAIRKTGRLVVMGCEVPGLLGREGKQIVGLEHDILEGFARELGLDLYVQFVPREAIESALLRGEADIAAGGLIEGDCAQEVCATPVHLPTQTYDDNIRWSDAALLQYSSCTFHNTVPVICWPLLRPTRFWKKSFIMNGC